MLPDIFNATFYSNKEQHTFWRYTFASLFAHTITRTFLAPVERLKILFQTQSVMSILPTDRFKTYRSAINRIYKEQGLLSFWRGNLANIQRVIPVNWVKFATYIHFKAEIFPKGQARYTGSDLILRHFSCGMASVFMVNLFTYPYDAVRTRQICELTKHSDPRKYLGTWATMKKLTRTEGYASLYKGFWIGNVFNAPYLALAFTFYEQIRAFYHPSSPSHTPNPESLFMQLMGAGGLAAAAASLLTYPLDTIRRKMMVNGGEGFNKEYKGVFDCIRKTAKGEGIKGFYAGFFANLIKIVPALGLQFSIYDSTRMFIFE